jgi:TusA-related sulfurtransferase
MPDNDFPILPSTRVAALLDRYPQLEDVLIGLAPPFKKLKNPFLRKGVARVASLKHAAVVGGIPVGELVNTLRAVVGQAPIASHDSDERAAYFSSQPQWFDAAKIVESIDEQEANPDQMPIVAVLQRAAALQRGEILELVTTFLPAPGIEIMKQKGFRVWSFQPTPELIRTYISKP